MKLWELSGKTHSRTIWLEDETISRADPVTVHATALARWPVQPTSYNFARVGAHVVHVLEKLLPACFQSQVDDQGILYAKDA